MANDPFTENKAGFPQALAKDYACLSCLKANETDATYLCQDRQNRKVIIKITTASFHAGLLENEINLLRAISQRKEPEAAFFPAPIDYRELEGEKPLFVSVRDCIPGHSLDAIVEAQLAQPGVDRKTALDCTGQVIALLSFLHNLEPPVIHRDIKPQNVIVDAKGRCHLIDLGISRLHREGEEADTTVFGTRVTAPPEQFGYHSTDPRSDLYSAGVLLRYCLTGEYGRSADAGLDRDVRRVVQKATRFDPDERYQTAEAFLRDLKRLQKPLLRRLAPWALPVCAAAAALLLWRLFLPAPPPQEQEKRLSVPVSAEETEAPSSALLPETGEIAITEAMFMGNQALYSQFIRGDYEECTAVILPGEMRIVEYVQFCDRDLNALTRQKKQKLTREQLSRCLDALSSSPLWKELHNVLLVNADIESLEPFRREYRTEHICFGFYHCILPGDMTPLESAAPILVDLQFSRCNTGQCESLQWLWNARGLLALDMDTFLAPDADLSALSRFMSLRILRLRDVQVTKQNLEAIGRMRQLDALVLSNCSLTDLTPLKRLVNLSTLDLRGNPDADFAPVEALTRLDTLLRD